ncbi:MAG: glycyl-radical enzyme activating protein [Candidatus Thorarchaeota archaeon]|nr:glycyl-radical enzyme activating protein [Candidatus Thorarchaeota archaeon]
MTPTGILTNIQRCSTEDGPGIRTSIFLKGCPLHCIWCHNIETLDSEPRLVWHGQKCIGDEACVRVCPEEALQLTSTGMVIDLEKCKTCGDCEDACPSGALEIIGKTWDAEKLVEELLRDKVFFETSNGGVTISGGEPLMQSEFVIAVASGLRSKGVHVAIDTSGYSSEATWRKVMEHVDMVLLDLKQMDPAKHKEYTGVPLDRILKNAKIIAELNIPVWIRTPIISEHTDTSENIQAISRFIVNEMPNVERYDLLTFNKMCIEKYLLFGLEYPLRDYDLIENGQIEKLAMTAKSEGVMNVVWSGMTKRIDTNEVKSSE